MKPFSLIHLSDLHFGRIHSDILRDLEKFLIEKKDDIHIAILTGDLTQRAKTHEFIAAKNFLEALHCKLFIVPGNHDVPLYNVLLRFLSPYKKFIMHLGPFAQNYYEDDHFAVYGLWTVDHFSGKEGKIRLEDLNDIEEKFKNVPAHKVKIIASHHPVMSIKHPRIKNDLKRLTDLNPHFFLWGHEHQSGVKSMDEEKPFPVIMAAGTSTSTRTRTEANSFNYITFNENEVLIHIYQHSDRNHEFYVREQVRIPLTSPMNFSSLFSS